MLYEKVYIHKMPFKSTPSNEYSYLNVYIQRVPKENIIYICLRNVIYKMNARRKRSYTIRLTTFSCTNARLIRSILKLSTEPKWRQWYEVKEKGVSCFLHSGSLYEKHKNITKKDIFICLNNLQNEYFGTTKSAICFYLWR